MPFLLVYILKLSVSLAVVFLFYHFVLRKLTFYDGNRWYLLGYTLMCFFIPLIDISPVLQRNNWINNEVVAWVPVIGNYQGNEINPTPAYNFFTAWNIISLLLVEGMLVMFLRLLFQLIAFQKMMNKSKLIPGEGMNLFQVDEEIIPFSFGNSIFINRHLHDPKELQEIIRHEFVHVKQKHSIDIIWGEWLCLINWYNPFAWLLKRSIRQNLEFIADNKVLENGFNKKQYQYLLLKVIGNNQFSIAPKFNFSSLKKRIAMMNKLKTAKVHLLKFLFLLPVATVMLLAFRKHYAETQPLVPGIPGNMSRDSIPEPPKNILPKEIISISLLQSKDDAVSIDPVKQKLHGLVAVKRKDGGIETYNLENKESRNDFEKKYGVKLEELIQPPTPPVNVVPGVPPVAPVSPVPPAGTRDVITPVAVSNGEGNNISRISSEYDITDKKAVIKLKDGTIEKYDLTNKNERSAFEKKYGKIINVRTTVNANVNANINANVNANINTSVNSVITPVAIDPSVLITTSPKVSLNSNLTTVIAPSAIRSNLTGTSIIASATPLPASHVAVINDYGHVITGKEDIIITITKNTTRQELENFKTQMKAKGIDLSFDEIEYNDKGLLVNISGSMKSKDGHNSFIATDFNKLILAMIKDGDRTYFKVSIRDNKEVI